MPDIPVREEDKISLEVNNEETQIVHPKAVSRFLRTWGGLVIAVGGVILGLTHTDNIQLVLIGFGSAILGSGVAEPTLVVNFVLKILKRQ